jgi:hypothetical protein
MKHFLIALLLPLSVAAFAADELPLDQCVSDPGHANFRVFQTKNIWTFLKLDTNSGLVWQVQWGDPHVTLPVNAIPLTSKQQFEPGRFTLCPTKNIFTFILLDQDDGRMWAVQWSMDDNSRFISPLFLYNPEDPTNGVATAPPKR